MSKRAKRKPSPPQKIDWETLVEVAQAARDRAYAPYSKFPVGAAVLGESGRIWAGCNVENSSFGLTVCAERNAVALAVLEGEKRILAAVVACGGDAAPPCGACRQVLAEFASPEVPIALIGGARRRTVHRLGDLLPRAFSSSFL
jgi:cytidine deaminase